MARFTKASLKSFIRKNQESLYILQKTSFNWMTDGVDETGKKDYRKIEPSEIDFNKQYNYWIDGLWMVWGSRNTFELINDKTIEIYNCCWKALLKTI